MPPMRIDTESLGFLWLPWNKEALPRPRERFNLGRHP
jgi:hypothetical protein